MFVLDLMSGQLLVVLLTWLLLLLSRKEKETLVNIFWLHFWIIAAPFILMKLIYERMVM
jgi:hypothetical protein